MGMQDQATAGKLGWTSNAIDPATSARSKFHFGMAIAMAIVVFAGFGPSFYLNNLLAEPLGMRAVHDLPALIIAHAIVLTAWMVLLVVQTGIAARGRIRLHRRLGTTGAVLAVLVVAFAAAAQFSSVRRAVRTGAYEDSAFLQSVAFGGFVTVTLFAGLSAAAIYLRRRPEAHKRLMLLATITLLGAATSRIGRMVELTLPDLAPMPLLGMTLTNLFLAALVVHDWRTTRRLHAATISGCLLILSMQVLGNGPLPGTPAMMQFVRWLVG